MSKLASTAAHRSFRRHAIAAGLLAASGAPLLAQADFAALSGELTVGSGSVSAPQVAVGPNGDSRVVYQVGALQSDIYLRQYDAVGNSRGAALLVNTVTGGAQRSPDVAVGAGGRSIVVWEGPSSDGQGIDIFAQRYDGNGARLGGEFRINKYTSGDQRNARVAMDASGGFLVTWLGQGHTGVPYSGAVHGRRFNANGAPLSDDFLACKTAIGAVAEHDLGIDAKGHAGMVCADRAYGPGSGEVALATLAAGSTQIRAIGRVGLGQAPSLAVGPAGAMVVAWAGYADGEDPYTGNTSIRARRYDAAGTAVSSNVRVNAYDYDAQFAPSAAMDANGHYLITWSTPWQDGDGTSVYAQRYSSGGLARGSEFRLNQTTAGDQDGSVLGVDADGDVVIAWENVPASGAASIVARRYRGEASVYLAATLSASRSSAAAGQTVTYTATLSNLTSPQAPTGVAAVDGAIGSALRARLTVTIPAQATLASAPTLDRPGSCVAGGAAYVCTLASPLPAGQVAKVSYVVKPNGGGDLLSSATAGTDSHDPYSANDSQSVTVSVLR